MSSLKAQIRTAVEQAMRQRDKPRLGALRLIEAAIKQKEVDERRELSDGDVAGVLAKRAKQHRDARAQFSAAGRDDLAERETLELETLQGFLPAMLTADEVREHVLAALEETGASGIRDMGKVMGLLKSKLQGQADMATVSELVKSRLSDR